jgi:hypothetical protein
MDLIYIRWAGMGWIYLVRYKDLLRALEDIAMTLLKLRGLIPRVNYTDRATAACRRSDCQLLRIEGATWSA